MAVERKMNVDIFNYARFSTARILISVFNWHAYAL